jgi:hypothetical protein
MKRALASFILLAASTAPAERLSRLGFFIPAFELRLALDDGLGPEWLQPEAPGSGRVVSLAVSPEQVTDGARPAEAASLGGYTEGRFSARSRTGALQQEWPVLGYREGVLHLGVGDAFDRGPARYDAEKLRLSAGTGLRPRAWPADRLEGRLEVGTQPIEDGTEEERWRLLLGASHGF